MLLAKSRPETSARAAAPSSAHLKENSALPLFSFAARGREAHGSGCSGAKPRCGHAWRAMALLLGLCHVVACGSDSGFLPLAGDGGGDAAHEAGSSLDGSPGDGEGGGDGAAADGGEPGAFDGAAGGDGPPADAAAVCTPAGACSPFVPSSCPSGQTCRAQSGGTVCGVVASAAFQEGQSCMATYECAAGLVCINLDAQGPRCHRMCPGNQVGTCGPNQACTTPVSGDMCLRLCTPLAPACNIYDSESCPGAKCDLASHPETGARYTACVAAGSAQAGQPCAGGTRCARGLICVNAGSGPLCRQVCDAQDGAPSCTNAGESCTGRSSLYGVTFCQ